MPEKHREDPRHAKHQREGEKIPLLAEKIYVWIAKKFQAANLSFKVSMLQSFKVKAFQGQQFKSIDFETVKL
jgi:hypothetical protein